MADGLSHGLGTRALLCWFPSPTLHVACGRTCCGAGMPWCVRRCLKAAMSDRMLISIVDDDEPYRDSVRKLVTLLGYTVESFPSAADFLASPVLPETACLVADVHMPGMTGVEL